MASWGKIGLFAGGVLFGTAGLKLLSSKDAKKVYTHSRSGRNCGYRRSGYRRAGRSGRINPKRSCRNASHSGSFC